LWAHSDTTKTDEEESEVFLNLALPMLRSLIQALSNKSHECRTKNVRWSWLYYPDGSVYLLAVILFMAAENEAIPGKIA